MRRAALIAVLFARTVHIRRFPGKRDIPHRPATVAMGPTALEGHRPDNSDCREVREACGPHLANYPNRAVTGSPFTSSRGWLRWL